MGNFEITDNFYLDGKPFQIISGAIHYFRIVPEYWQDRLEKLKAMGCNTVETYIPWNMHEPKKGEFHFEGMLDIEQICKNGAGTWVICDFKTVAVHLCGVGIWRTAGVAVSGRWNETARFLSAVFKTCAGLL